MGIDNTSVITLVLSGALQLCCLGGGCRAALPSTFRPVRRWAQRHGYGAAVVDDEHALPVAVAQRLVDAAKHFAYVLFSVYAGSTIQITVASGVDSALS